MFSSPKLQRARATLLAAGLMLVAGIGRANDEPVLLIRPSATGPFTPVANEFLEQVREPVREFVLDEAEPAELAQIARANPPAVVVALGARAAQLAHETFPGTPLVYGMVPDPPRLGLIGPGITGVSARVSPDIELAEMRKVLPALARLGLLYGGEASRAQLERMRDAAQRAGVTVVEIPVPRLSDLPRQLGRAMREVDALWVARDAMLANRDAFRYLVEVTLEHRKPMFVFAAPLVRAGALAAIEPDARWVGHALADRVAMIRAGTVAGELPETSPPRACVIFNPATARALGVAMPGDGVPLAGSRP